MNKLLSVSLISLFAFSAALAQSEGASIVKYLQWNGVEWIEMTRATVLNSELENAQAKCQQWVENAAGISRYCQTSRSQLQ